ncbi:MAG: alpha/beta fold hydrolase [Myxococcota bacterium]
MNIAAWILGLAAGAVFVLVVAVWFYAASLRRFRIDLFYALHERVPTGDGSHVEIRRLPSAETPHPGRPPVLLVHGLGFNHRNQDLTEELSLGRYLARAGRDVWLLTLRSGREDLSFAEERRCTFDQMAREDLPRGIEAVRQRTGGGPLDYVGFSMGGMLLYAALGTTVPSDALRRVAIVGSPAVIRPPLRSLAKVARAIPGFIIPTLRLRLVSNFMAFGAEMIRTPVHHWIYNPANVDGGVAGHALVNGFVNIPAGLAAEFVTWAGNGSPVTFAGVPVTTSLQKVTPPALFIAGRSDHLAPPEAVQLAFEAWGKDGKVEKAFTVASIEAGAAANYGHGDLVLGREAAKDVFEPVRRWLDELAA